MIPLRDENPTTITPVVTIFLIVINLGVFMLQLAIGLQRSVLEFGLIPAELIHGADIVFAGRRAGLDPGLAVENLDPAWITLFSSMFMHGGWLHILGNMWFLWIFGNNIEDDMGHGKFLVFYIISGLAAAAAQVLMGTTTPIPMVGASGAIGGVLGAYLVLFPGSKVLCLITTIIITMVELPAWIVLGFWFVLQFLSGVVGFLGPRAGGVAYAAHVGGFVCGMILGRMMGKVRRPPSSYNHYNTPPPTYTDWR